MLGPLAQELADSISKVIGYDVVIADTEGIIMGCSDPQRGVGSLNEACAIVAKTGQPQLETEEDARRLKGTKPGATYPIMDSQQQVVGAVAITGDPKKVKPFALLVKNQAELYLRERIIARELLERERNLQALVADIALFRSGVNDPQVIEAKASLMGYDKSLSYAVLVADAQNPKNPRGHYPEGNRTLMDIHQVFDAAGNVSGPIGPHRYVIFCPAQGGRDFSAKSFYSGLLGRCERFLSLLQRRNFSATIGVGSLNSGVPGLAVSYREALMALQMGVHLFPHRKVHLIADFRVEELLMNSEMALQNAMVERELAPLFARTDGNELQDTIVAWCESGFSVVRAAELLHVHRTTVDYRLEKIEHILEVKPRDFREMSRLYWAVILWRNGRGHRPRNGRRP